MEKVNKALRNSRRLPVASTLKEKFGLEEEIVGLTINSYARWVRNRTQRFFDMNVLHLGRYTPAMYSRMITDIFDAKHTVFKMRDKQELLDIENLLMKSKIDKNKYKCIFFIIK